MAEIISYKMCAVKVYLHDHVSILYHHMTIINQYMSFKFV
jgi:hypothetical protein